MEIFRKAALYDLSVGTDLAFLTLGAASSIEPCSVPLVVWKRSCRWFQLFQACLDDFNVILN